MTDPSDPFDAIRDFYDNEYYSRITVRSTLPWHTRQVAARLGNIAGQNVLDVACGTGEWLGYLQRDGASICGIDLSQKAVDECVKRFPTSEFICSPAETLPFTDGRFDLVTCMGSLEHFLDKKLALTEMRRVAGPNARVLILVPNAGFLTRRLGLYGGTQQTRAREDVFDLATWAGMLESAGFEILARWRDLHPISRPWIFQGSVWGWPVRAAQAFALGLWPLRWQYQVYHYCRISDG